MPEIQKYLGGKNDKHIKSMLQCLYIKSRPDLYNFLGFSLCTSSKHNIKKATTTVLIITLMLMGRSPSMILYFSEYRFVEFYQKITKEFEFKIWYKTERKKETLVENT